MKSQKLAHFFSLERRYYRSVNLERDLKSRDALHGYLLTERSAEALDRIVRAFSDLDAHRAWTLTGVYGTGKSAFAHFLANLLSPLESQHRKIAIDISKSVFSDDHPFFEVLSQAISEQGLYRAIATGQREPLNWTIIRGLTFGSDLFWKRGNRPNIVRQLTDWQVEINSGECAVTNQQVLNMIEELVEEAKAPIFFIIDELGKNLEFAAQNLGKQDLYLLQQIAELKQSRNYPVFFLGLLHQTFDGYSERLATVEKQEWNKIQGRFEDISFRELPSQMTRLIGRVINRTQAVSLLKRVERLAQSWHEVLPDLYSEHEVSADIIGDTYPLHPLTALALPQLCLQYAQNDRSLFTFLTSDEPYSFKSFLKGNDVSDRTLPTFKLHHFYDYFVESVAGIASRFNLQRWVEIQRLIFEARDQDPHVLKVLKSIGILNLVSSTGSLRATPELVALSLCDSPRDFKQLKHWQTLIQNLRDKGLVTYRRALDELRLWQGSDFDVELAIQNKIEETRQTLASLLSTMHPLQPIVAQRHLLQTGTLRLFEQRYVDSTGRLEDITCSDSSHDGMVAYWMDMTQPTVIPETTKDGKPFILVAPQNLETLYGRVQQLYALRKIKKESPELNSDGVARREVKQRLFEAERLLDETLQYIFAGQDTQNHYWVSGKLESVPNIKVFRALISEVCDLTYPQCLILDNELINRRQLTSQAAKARRLVIEAMIERGNQERLDFKGYGPEVAIYYSVLESTGIHRQNDDGWEFGPPVTGSGIDTVWNCIETFCLDAKNEQRSLDKLYDRLSKPPYGVKQGVIPILLAAVLLYRVDDVGIYKEGTFIPVLGPEHFELLVKEPSRFSVKYFEILGLRSQVFKELEAILKSPNAKSPAGLRNVSLLAIAKPLFGFVRQLPEFTQSTIRLSSEARKVLQALQTAQEPDALLFVSLPEACGLKPITTGREENEQEAKAFRKKLVQCIHEIQTAYDNLLTDCQKHLYEAFGIRSKEASLREDLRVRASYLVGQCIDPILRHFVAKAVEEESSDRDWLEALVRIVADKHPKGWIDEDFSRFEISLSDLVRRFENLEALRAEIKRQGKGFEALRITVTEPNGQEVHEVVWIDEEYEELFDQLTEEVLNKPALKNNPRLQKIFLAKLNKRLLSRENVNLLDEFGKSRRKRDRLA
ncbi:hypothetical protein [Lyngbya confervoides]|uniref:ATP-binding protein n=1 Tax=Lyngbya confervoides BDU141951 TaxID=1574623 RepID=A0ABD4T0Q2_9CYAN|nr:hypothetical protein [Lyngbya confervoides]MCM1982005.1 hypothetical protein [Lyngbya confervoides BDU141951]